MSQTVLSYAQILQERIAFALRVIAEPHKLSCRKVCLVWPRWGSPRAEKNIFGLEVAY